MKSRLSRADRPSVLLVWLVLMPCMCASAASPAGDATAPQQPSLSCVAQPATVFSGDPVNVQAQLTDTSARIKSPVFTWSSTGGQIANTNGGARIETSNVAAGDYIVTGRVRSGHHKNPEIECKTAFRVMPNAPPTVACSASPAKIVPGGFTTISATAQSTVNRPLTYSYGASAGQITGTGPTASLAATDVNPGTITVKCNVMDDRGQAASTTIAVDVVTPPPPPVAPPPATRRLCSVKFERDRKRPVRVDNEGKACLDDIALQLTHDPNAALVVVGKHDSGENPEAAAERTLNIKQYMTNEKGIDPSRIQARTGENTGRIADDVLVPQGAMWDPAGTTDFDPSQIQRHGEPYSRTAH